MSRSGVWSIRYAAPTYMVLITRRAAAAGTAACLHKGLFLFLVFLVFLLFSMSVLCPISMPPSASAGLLYAMAIDFIA